MIPTLLIVIAATTTLALIWRALLLDHERLLARVRAIPFAGSALACGFCMAIWFSLGASLAFSPLAPWLTQYPYAIAQLMDWFALSAGVLLLRNLIAVLLEGTGVLTHLHRGSH